MDFRQFLRLYPAKGSTHQSRKVLGLVWSVSNRSNFSDSDRTAPRLIETKKSPNGAWIPDSAIELMERLDRRRNSTEQDRILQESGRPKRTNSTAQFRDPRQKIPTELTTHISPGNYLVSPETGNLPFSAFP